MKPQNRTFLFALALLVASPLVLIAPLPAADQETPDWTKRSNEHSQILLKIMARLSPRSPRDLPAIRSRFMRAARRRAPCGPRTLAGGCGRPSATVSVAGSGAGRSQANEECAELFLLPNERCHRE